MLHPETVRVFYSKIIYSVILAHHPGANLGNPLLSGRSGDHLRRKLCSSQDCTTKISGIQFFKAFLLQNLPHYWGSSWRTHGLGGQNEPGVPAPSSPRRGGTSTGLSVCWICRRGLFWSPPPSPEEFSATAGALQHVSEMLSAVKNLDKHKFGSGRFPFIFPSLVCLEKEPGHLAKGFDASIHNLPSLD